MSILLDDESVERIIKMIRAHEMQTGRTPSLVQMPDVGLKVHGVEVHFYRGKDCYTCDSEKTIHHQFVDHK